jgi:hypothetical protein
MEIETFGKAVRPVWVRAALRAATGRGGFAPTSGHAGR